MGAMRADDPACVWESPAAEMEFMDKTTAPLFQTPDEQRRMTFDLMNRILGAIDQWGKTHSGKNIDQMRDITMDALLKSITVLCVHK